MRISIRELLLVILCVALALGYWRARRVPVLWSTKHETSKVGGGEVTAVIFRSNHLNSGVQLQHKPGGNKWSPIAELRTGTVSETALFVFESESVDGVSEIEISCAGQLLLKEKRDALSPLSVEYFGIDISSANTSKTVFHMSWTDPGGQVMDHRFRMTPTP